MVNGFYLAKKKLKIASNLDLICMSCWSFMIFIIAIYHFAILIPFGNGYSSLNSTETSSQQNNNSSSFTWSFISGLGYSKFFGKTLIDFILFKFTLWHIILPLFLVSLISFLGKILLGTLCLFVFIKAKSIQHIFAAISVIFLPLVGGLIASNVYNSTTSPISPKYIASNSLLRFKIRNSLKGMGKHNVKEQ